MNNKNNNYRVMKFLEPVNKSDKSKGYVRLDIRGIRGTLIVSVENLGDGKSSSEVYLYKDKNNKIKVGTVNNRKGMIKRTISLANNSTNFEDYNICGVVKDNKIVLYANLFNAANLNDVRKLEEDVQVKSIEESYEENKNTSRADEVSGNEEYEEIKETGETEEIDRAENEVENEVENEAENETSDEAENRVEEKMEWEKKQVVSDEVNVSKKDEIIQEEPKSLQEKDSEMKITNNEEETVEGASKKTAYKNKFEENLYTILKEYRRITPLSVDIKSMSWWKIPYDDRGVKNGFLPYYDQIISSYYPYPMSNRVTTCHSLMRKYGYYLFGIYKDNNKNIKKFVYGVPGEFKREEQPYKGITGFKNWSYKNKEINGDYGFWLAFVDSRTGEVTEPPQIVG
jgi:hypothetical protein